MTTLLAIDGALSSSGYAVVDLTENRLIHLGWVKTSQKNTRAERLHQIHEQMLLLRNTYTPDVVVMEDQIFRRNVKTLKSMSQAGGVCMVSFHDIPIVLYTPKEIKLSVVGKGTASKEEVAHFVYQEYKEDSCLQSFLSELHIPYPFSEKHIKKINDITDAIGIAITYINRQRTASNG